jgi:cathepsin E
MVAAFLLTALFLAVAAQPPVSRNLSPVKLPFAKRASSTGTTNLVKHDQLRVKTLEAKAQGLEDLAIISSPATNRIIFYIASVGIGSPATYCK